MLLLHVYWVLRRQKGEDLGEVGTETAAVRLCGWLYRYNA